MASTFVFIFSFVAGSLEVLGLTGNVELMMPCTIIFDC